jgi:cephalosporin-C deacetylase-like acetyl esterase
MWLHAQKVEVNKATPDYSSSALQFKVTGTTTANYKIILDRQDDYSYGFAPGTTEQVLVASTAVPVGGIINYTAPYAGVFICIIDQGSFPNNMAAAVYNAFGMPPQNTEPFSPQTFDAFWNGIKNDASVATPNVTESNCTSNCAPAGYISKTLSVTVLGKTITGNLCYPSAAGKYPAIIWNRAYSAPAASNSEMHTFLGSTNCALISMNAKDAGTADEAGASNFADQNTYNYKYTQAALYAIMNYLYNTASATYFDNTKGVGLWGESQGGGMSLLLAGLNGNNNRIKALLISNPATCEQRGFLNGKVSAFPDWVRQNPGNQTNVANASRYFDAAVAAGRVTAPVYINMSYVDWVTPSMSTYAAVNNLKGSITIAHGMQKKHEHGYNGIFSGLEAAYFKKHLQAIELTSNSGYAYYYADAGPNTNTATVGSPLSLSGSIKINGSNYAGGVKWSVVSGGTATFGSSTSLSTTVTFSTAGTYVLKLESTNFLNTDPNGVANIFHSFSDYMTVTVTAAQPDYVVQTVGTPSPTGVAAGSAVSLTGAVIQNNGTATATSSKVKFYRSTDQSYDAGDVQIGAAAGVTVTGLAAGATFAVPAQSLTIPSGTAVGKYYIIVRADADLNITESNENNNTAATVQITVGPDYTVSVAGTPAPTTVNPGNNVTLTGAQVRNIGSATSTASNVRFYLSTDQTYNVGDVQIGSTVNVAGLAFNAVNNLAAQTLTIPAGTANGTYYILVFADATALITEASEANNTAATIAITVGTSCTSQQDCGNGNNNATIQGCVLSAKATLLTANVEYIKIWNSTYSTSWWLCSPWGGGGQPACTNGTTPTLTGLTAGTYHAEVKYVGGTNCFTNNVIVTASFASGSDDRDKGGIAAWDERDIRVYPNPTNDFLNVELNLPEGINPRVQVLNALGQALPTFDNLSGGFSNMQLSLASLDPGLYFISLQYGGKRVVKSFVKQ